MSEHIVKSFDRELEQLKQNIVQMGGLAENQLAEAIRCIVKRDTELAHRVVRNDSRLDDLEAAIDAEAVRVLATRQPMASDLREVVSALKIAADLERIGDYSANLAKRSVAIAQVPVVRPVNSIPRMGRLVQGLIKEVLDAYAQRNLDQALEAWHRDKEVDELHTSLFRETLTYMMEDPRNITSCTHILFIAKNIERIGDLATNIAETIHFLIAGSPLDASRPKGTDDPAYATMQPDDHQGGGRQP